MASSDINVNAGAIFISGDNTVIDIWQIIHQNALAWGIDDIKSNEREMLDGTDTALLNGLESLSSTDWRTLCGTVGWTVYGAIALSWCEGAKLEDVWAGWLASGFPLKPLPEFERPARFINPALLPKTNKSGEINAMMKDVSPNAEAYQLAVCATIAALKEPLEFELEPENYKGAMPQIAAFLKSRMLQKPDRTPEENAIVEVWSEKIKGTEWDIWNKEGA